MMSKLSALYTELGSPRGEIPTNLDDWAADYIETLRNALADAIEDIDEWGQYASPYFRDKYNLAGDIERYQLILTSPGKAGESDLVSCYE